jgi:hypothetical protein
MFCLSCVDIIFDITDILRCVDYYLTFLWGFCWSHVYKHDIEIDLLCRICKEAADVYNWSERSVCFLSFSHCFHRFPRRVFPRVLKLMKVIRILWFQTKKQFRDPLFQPHYAFFGQKRVICKTVFLGFRTLAWGSI